MGKFHDDGTLEIGGFGSEEIAEESATVSEIDGKVFVKERKIPFHNYGQVGECQRPLRAQAGQFEMNTLAHSETVQEGSYIELTIFVLDSKKCDLMELVKEWLDYGKLRGLGQWRNSGKGRFTWEEIK